MAKLSISKLSQSANECMGWPYVSPGSNDANGIDCSGLFVKMYRDQDAKIYHGSNTIFREYCSSTGKLTKESQLQAGMAVFKLKDWTDADKDNRWYGKDPGNLSHIGYVDSVNPLRIIHASSAAGCVTTDTKISKWAYWGKLKDVDYGGSPDPDPDPGQEPVPEKTMKVYAENGKPVNLRKAPKTSSPLVDRVPVGELVTVKAEQDEWSNVDWKKKTGWMMSSFLVDPDTPDPTPTPEPDPTPTPEPPIVVDSATVFSDNGKPVKMRAQPTTSCKLYDELPVGTVVEVNGYNCVTDSKGNQWTMVSYQTRNGWYIMTRFLSLG